MCTIILATLFLFQSHASNDCAAIVTLLFKTILCRVPEASGLYHYTAQCQNGLSAAAIEQQLRQTSEFHNCAECQQGCSTDKWSTYGEGRCETNHLPISAPAGFTFDGTFAPPGTMYYTERVTLEQCGDLCLAQDWCGFFSWKKESQSNGKASCYISAHCDLVNTNDNGYDNDSHKYESYKIPEKYCSRFPDLTDLSTCENCQMQNCVLECDCGHGRSHINIKDKCTDTKITVKGGALVCKSLESYKEFGDVNEALSIQSPCSPQLGVMRHAECRTKSTSVFQTADATVASDFNGLLWSFGQFVDHDLDLVKEDSNEIVHIPYDMDGSSEFEFEFHRAESQCPNGEYGNRKNSVTARIDLSQVYGSTLEQEMKLRDPTDSTRIKIGPNDELQPHDDNIFCCGDVRCGENPFLTSQHVLWLKHHNVLVDEIIASGSTLQGDALYEEAKQLNIATYQRIVDKEFLPALVGPTPAAKNWKTGDWIAQIYDSTKIDIGSLFLNENEGSVSAEMCRDMVFSLDACKKQYITFGSGGECICATVEGFPFLPATSEWKTYEINREWMSSSQGDMSMSNLFANAAYRLHHLVNDEFEVNGQTQSLKDGYFVSATSYMDHGSLNGWFTRLLEQKSNKFGAHMASSLQHALFSGADKPCHNHIDGSEQDCRDLAALNCLRGIDVGLPTYNEVREMFGLPQREDFDWSENACTTQLGELYEWDIDRVELFMGGSCEQPVPGAVLGETFLVIVKDQFLRLRDNDPNWIAYKSPGYSYKEVINRCTNVDSNNFHEYSSFLHKDTPTAGVLTQKSTQEQFMLQIRGLQGKKDDLINKKVLDQDTLQINEVF